MTIRAQFHDDVDEFIDNLETFATGSYLHDDEKDLWDQPFDPAVIPAVRSELEKYLDQLDQISQLPSSTAGEALDENIIAAYRGCIDRLEELNTAHNGAVIEPEEREELRELLGQAATATGLSEQGGESLPEF